MRWKTIVLLSLGLLAGTRLFQTSSPLVAQSQEPKPAVTGTEPQPDAPEIGLIHQSAMAFATAFDAGDAAGIAALFSENAEIVDEEGDLTLGRAAIQERFATFFQTYPEARIAIEIGSVRLLGPDVAIEDGVSATALSPDDPGVSSPYTVVHVKRDGVWRFASVRDYPAEEEATLSAHEQLEPLAWLIGEWVDENREGRVETSYRWSDDGNYLLQDYLVKTPAGAQFRGTQRIGYDPLRRTIRAWAFDESGTFSESFWTPVEERWVIKATGVTADGQAASATRTLIPFENDAFDLISTDQRLGDEPLADASVRVVRRPPTPE